jgi:hypothetical protein
MSGVRYTQYLGQAEKDELDRVAAEQGSSPNYIARAAIRNLLGFNVPNWVTLMQARADESRRRRKEAS